MDSTGAVPPLSFELAREALARAAAGVDTHPGDAERLRQYWEHGEGGAKIGWGTAGDFDRCVALVADEANMTPEQAKGYCNERHHGATGMWPSQHAAELRASAVPQLVTLPGVDLVAAGTWGLSSGRQTFTRSDLQSAIDSATCPAVGAPLIKLGHVDPRFNGESAAQYDGQPAIGRVANMRLDASGNMLVGDLAGMPGWLGQIAHAAYPQRSVEGQYDFRCQIGHVHQFVITGLALLGVTPPGVGVLNSLPDIAALYGVQAGAPFQFPSDLLAAQEARPVAITEEDVRRAYYAGGGAPKDWWITELQMHPTQLVVTAGDGTMYRVPFTINGPDRITFQPPEQVESYAALAASRGTGTVVTYASAEASRAVNAADTSKPYGDVEYGDPGYLDADGNQASKSGKPGVKRYPLSPDKVMAAWSYINQAKNAGQYTPTQLAAIKAKIKAAMVKHGHDVSDDGKQTAAARLQRAQAFSAAMATDADEDAKQLIASLDALLDQASALAAQIDPAKESKESPEAAQVMDLVTAAEAIVDQVMDKLGIFDPDDQDADDNGPNASAADAPTLNGDQVTGADTNAMMGHGPCTATHSHPHPAYGAQGSDQTHSHSHTHTGDADHAHTHAASGQTQEGGSAVDFTNEQEASLRASLGLGDNGELGAEAVVAAAAQLRTDVAAKTRVAAGKGLPDTAMVVDRQSWEDLQSRVAAADRFRIKTEHDQRDEIIQAAVRAGKFSASRVPQWQRAWDADPEGTREILASLPKNIIPVTDLGTPGGDLDGELDKEFAGLYPPGTFNRK